MKNENYNIINKDCIKWLKKIESDSIDMCLTDPPYNYEFLNHDWNQDEINRRIDRVKDSKTLIKYIPYWSWLSWWVRNKRWYEKNYNNTIEYTDWSYKWWKEVYRVMKSWWYALIFNSSRSIAHIQIAMEKAGFYTRDILVWRKHSGIPKWLNYAKKLEKLWMKDYKKYEWFHSCLKNEWESILLVQKPLINNYQNTLQKTWLWLMKTDLTEWVFQSNILENFKRDKKDEFNSHCTVKPLWLIKRLIKMCVPLESERVILDPFLWSWTTAVAANELWLKSVWFEINKTYYEIIKKRLSNIK